MAKKGSAPPPPNYGPLIQAMQEQSQVALQIGQEQLAWAREQDALNRPLAERVTNQALDISSYNNDIARRDRARYENVYQPLEDDLVKEAKDFATPARADFEAGRAQSAVSNQFNAARQAAIQNLESFGIDPTAVRYAALDRGARVAQGAASAAAGTNARLQTENVGRALRSEAINVGRGYPGQVARQFGAALQGGNQGINSSLAATASGAQTMGTGAQWSGIGTGALSGAGNMMNQQYQNQMAAYNAERQQTSGIGSLLGIGASFLSGGTTPWIFAEEGGAIPDPQATTGGAIPTEMSPSGGQETDDVAARLNAGEFVVPKDTVSWLGERFFQNLIEKARKAKGEAPAKPEMKQALPQAPAFVSRQALPV